MILCGLGRRTGGRRSLVVEEVAEQAKRRLGLLFMGHVSAFIHQLEARIGQGAPELQADVERHDTIMVAPQDERWLFNRFVTP